MKRAKLLMGFGIGLATCLSPSLIHPWGNLRAGYAGTEILKGSSISPDVKTLLEMKCGDCHSDNTRWPVYSRVAPVSWLVERDVHEGRQSLNLSRWEQYSSEMQIGLLTRVASEARSGQMPLKQYVRVHSGKQLSGAEQQQIYDWARGERKRLKNHAVQAQSTRTPAR